MGLCQDGIVALCQIVALGMVAARRFADLYKLFLTSWADSACTCPDRIAASPRDACLSGKGARAVSPSSSVLLDISVREFQNAIV